jgi:D-ribose pyranase
LLDVVRAVAGEMMIERAEIATEMRETSATLHAALAQLLQEIGRAQGRPIIVEACTHAILKDRTARARAVVRSGECTPYANVILYAGVAFGPPPGSP